MGNFSSKCACSVKRARSCWRARDSRYWASRLDQKRAGMESTRSNWRACFGEDGGFAFDDLVDHFFGSADAVGELGLGHAELLQFFEEDFAGRGHQIGKVFVGCVAHDAWVSSTPRIVTAVIWDQSIPPSG